MNRTFVLACFLFVIFSTTIYAQYENVWVFGQRGGLDFNSGQPELIRTSIEGFGEALASVCDNQGQLLFYTEGNTVWNRNGTIMPNGQNLVPPPFRDDNPVTSSTSQGTVIVPISGSESKYYIFSLTCIEQGLYAGRLYYSIVDLMLNNGLGDVIAGQKGILLDSNLAESMTTVTGNKCNIWLLVRASQENTIKAYSISVSGINIVPKLSKVAIKYGSLYAGTMNASPDGSKVLVANIPGFFGGGGGDIELFNFDKLTGKLSDAIILDDKDSYYGIAFSPDGSKVYGSSQSSLYQFDLSSPEPKNSKTLIGPCNFTHVKLAPDGKIYFRSDKLHYLSAITSPNLSGTACGFTPDIIQAFSGISFGAGLPNVVSVVIQDTSTPVNTAVSAPCWFNESIGYTLRSNADGWDYIWDDSSNNQSRTINTPGKYWVTYSTAPCRFHTDTFIVSIPYGVLPQIRTEASCRNTANGKAWAYTYPEDTVTYHYTWRNTRNDILSATDTLQDAPAGSYTLHISTAECDTLLYIDIPRVGDGVYFMVDTLACIEDTIKFQNTSDPYYTDFIWSFGDSIFSTLHNPDHIYTRSDSFNIRLVGIGSQCRDTAYKTIIVDALPSALFVSQPDSICVGQSISFFPQEADHTVISRIWSFGDNTNIKTTYDHTIQHAYATSGIMPVTMQASYRACPDQSFADTVFIQDLPTIDLGTDSFLCLKGNGLTLRNLRDASSRHLTYLWNTGDTTEGIEVKRPGFYSLTATTEPLGCITTETIEVKKGCYVDLPNAFTPDGDGYNDYFFPRQLLSQNVAAFKVQIFNRWGQIVFETTSLEGRGWDGKLKGKEQPSGVYVYFVEVTLNNGHRERYEGNVTLIR